MFFPSSPERQLSNSLKCVKSNLYFLTGCNIWVLNKEEHINVWPSLRAPRITVENAAMGAQHSQQSNANIPGVTLTWVMVLRMPASPAQDDESKGQ